MDNDKLKDIPLEIVGTTNEAPDEDVVVQEGKAILEGQLSPNTEIPEPADNAEQPVSVESVDDAEPSKKSTSKKHKQEQRENDELIKEGIELKKVIADQAREDEREGSFNQSLKKILVGEMLNSRLLRENIGLMIVVVVFVVISITNRYTVQQNMLERSKLEKELQDTKFRALSASSDLTERTRKSRIIEVLRDTTLKEPEHPAFLIEVPTN